MKRSDIDDSLNSKIYSFIQIIDILLPKGENNKKMQPFDYRLPLPEKEIVNILSKLNVDSMNYSKTDDKLGFLRTMRNCICHNYGTNSFGIQDGEMIFKNEFGADRLSGKLSVNKFMMVMDDLLLRFSEVTNKPYYSFFNTSIFDKWDKESVDSIADSIADAGIEKDDYENSVLFVKKVLDKCKTPEDVRTFIERIKLIDMDVDGIRLSPLARRLLIKYCCEHPVPFENPQQVFKDFLGIIKRRDSYINQSIRIMKGSSDKEEILGNRELIKRVINSRRERALSVLSDLVVNFGMLKTEEQSNEFAANDKLFLISFSGFDGTQFDLKFTSVPSFAFVGADSFKKFEYDVVEALRDKRAELLQRIRNAMMHNYMISLEYNYQKNEYDIVFKYEKGDVFEIRVGTQELYDFNDYINQYLANKNLVDEKRDIHKAFLDYVFLRTSNVDQYEDYFSRNTDYQFETNRDICRFVYDFYQLMEETLEIDPDRYYTYLAYMYNSTMNSPTIDFDLLAVDLRQQYKDAKRIPNLPYDKLDNGSKRNLIIIFRDLIKKSLEYRESLHR